MEHHLIENLRRGDRKSFDKIYFLYARPLLSFAMKHVKSAEDAEDLVQEVFIALWRNRDTVINSDTLRPLLFTALRNRIINYHRSVINSQVYADYISTVSENDVDAGRDIEFQEFRKMVIGMIGKLPATQRKVIMLSRFHGMNTNEIATSLGLSVQTVKNAMSAGLAGLRKMIAGSGSGELLSFIAMVEVQMVLVSVI